MYLPKIYQYFTDNWERVAGKAAHWTQRYRTSSTSASP